MFATLAGGLPLPPATDADTDDATDPTDAGTGNRTDHRTADRAALDAILGAQVEAGLELLTGGRSVARWDPYELIADGVAGLEPGASVPDPGGGPTPVRSFRVRARPTWTRPLLVDSWRAATTSPAAAGRVVKQVVPGPVTLGRIADPGSLGRRAVTLALAEALNAELRALADAGCAVIQVDEPAATLVGDARSERRLWLEAHRVLTNGLDRVHLSLAVLGGSAHGAGGTTIFEPPYSSFLFDLVDGPDNWYLVRAAPSERGIVVGALDARPDQSEAIEILVWAGLYAASSNDRGPVRVGLATANSLAGCAWDDAIRRMSLLGRAALRAGDPNVSEPRGRRIDLVATYARNVERRAARDRAADAEPATDRSAEAPAEPAGDAATGRVDRDARQDVEGPATT